MLARVPLGARSALSAALLLLACVAAGCGGPKKLDAKPVQAKVVFEKGGTVKALHLAETTVVFESLDTPGLEGRGMIAEDGRVAHVVCISLTGEGTAYGLVEGTYRVRFEMPGTRKDLLHPRFLSAESSGITVRVPSDEEIVLKVWR